MNRVAGLFSSLANALLDLGLPRMRAWLRERVGDGADVAQVSTEAGFVHLDGVVLPIGPRGVVSLERATAAVSGAARRAAGLPEARLHAFYGAVRFGGEGEPSFVADVVFRAEPHPDERAWIAGELVIGRATWDATGRPARPMSGSAKLFVTSTEWRLDDGVLESERAKVRFWGRGALDGSARGGGVSEAKLVLEAAKVGPFLDAASAIAGRTIAVPPGVPIDAGITGELAFDATSGGKAELAIDAEGLELRMRGSVGSDGSALDARVDARARPAIAMQNARVPAKLLPREEDEITLALHVTGEATRPVVTGTVRAAELAFRAGRPRFVPPAAVITDLSCELASEGDQALARATARAGAGALTLHLDVPVREPRSSRARVWVKDLDATWVSNLLGAVDARVSLPRDARASAELEVTLEGATGEASIVTPRSRIAVAPISVSGRELGGTRLSGDIAWADALTLGLDRLSVRPTPEGAVTVELELRGEADDPSARGTLASPRLALAIASREDVVPFDLLDARASVTVARDALSFEDLTFRAYDASLRGEGRIPFRSGERSRAVLGGQGGVLFVSALARLLPRAPTLPDAVRISGEVGLGGETSLTADVLVDTGAERGTSVSAHVVLARDDRIDGTFARGHLGLVDVIDVLGVDPALFPEPNAAATIDTVAKGSTAAPVIAGFAAADVLRIAAPGVAMQPVVLTEASALFRIDRERAVWHKLEARAHGGTLASAGVLVRREGDLVAKVGVRDIALETLPLGEAGAGSLEGFVTGRLSGAMRFDRHGGALSGRGKLVVDDAFFPVVARARPELARYGLEPPHPRANAPASVEVALAEGGVALSAIRVSLPGCSAEGDVRIAPDASLDGTFKVVLDEEYLGSSPVLVLPSVLAERLTLPVRIGGTVREPKIDADLAACFGRFMTQNRVSAFVSDAAQEVASLFGARPAARPTAPPPEPVGTEDEDLAGELTRASEDWTELEPRLEAHRRAARHLRVRVRE